MPREGRADKCVRANPAGFAGYSSDNEVNGRSFSSRAMRIVSYNILDGGEGRADPLAEVIEAQRPDVVALVEAEDLNVVERIAKRVKMDFVHAPGNAHASVLMSRWTIRESINHAPLRPDLEKSLLEATVATPAFG